ncbi:hypothetical protein RWH43_17065 [Microbacterium sp. KSW2-21]|uniref:DUF3618 domain-containing protein n=1 Tax=Microbacterium algihabitans TaxID=3075992 RepID=A0ABU3S026_9MICO|nr:hypothetical protein [Microbacterium sp. KSW2-21]MDU0328472.1 hypothetical protein [Microbacterium sp. KSW2-21]
MTTSDRDAENTAKERVEDATHALHDAAPGGKTASSGVVDHASVEFDEVKQHAESAIDTTFEAVSSAAGRARETVRRNPKKVLFVTVVVSLSILGLVAVLRRV